MTYPDRYSYCKLYVADGDRDAVTASISEVVGTGASGYYIDTRSLSFDILRNPDFDQGRQSEFLCWPIVVDVTNEDDRASDMVEVISEVIRAFWSGGKSVVAACPFEDE